MTSSFGASFNSLFGQPSDPDPFDAAADADSDSATASIAHRCQYERAMRASASRLLECSYRYPGGGVPGVPTTATTTTDHHAAAAARGADDEQARDTGVHAVLEQYDTAIPRSVLPWGSRAAKPPPPTEVGGGGGSGGSGGGRVRSFRRMGSSLLSSCVAPAVGCLDGVDDGTHGGGGLLEEDGGGGAGGSHASCDNDMVVAASGSRNSQTTERREEDAFGQGSAAASTTNPRASSPSQQQPPPRPPSVAANSLASNSTTSRRSQSNNTVHTQPGDEVLHMHAIRVTSPRYHGQDNVDNPPTESATEATATSTSTISQQQPPLVLLHGYANGSLYFYRNLHGLAGHFPTVYAVDMMGWGLSSRPPFPAYPADHDDTTKDKEEEKEKNGEEHQHQQRSRRKAQSVGEAEDFFVESLESWRRANGIDRMVLGGHSLGGYVSVAYTERYPQRVAKLLLLSPVGVPGEPTSHRSTSNAKAAAAAGGNGGNGGGGGATKSSGNPKSGELPPSPAASNVPIVAQVAKRMAQSFFDAGWTPGAVIRTVGKTQGMMGVESYVDKRLPGVQCPQERTALIDYLYHNAVLPPSGEGCLNRLLLPGAYAVHPLSERVPRLKVAEVVFIYGEKDWMDPTAGMDVERYCRQQRAEGNLDVPDVSVRAVRRSGHLLMIENWEGFNAAVILACGGVLDPDVARMHRPASFVDNKRRRHRPYYNSRLLAATGSETTEESYGSQEGVELDLTGKYIIEEEEDFIEYGKEATFTEKCTGVSIRKPTLGR